MTLHFYTDIFKNWDYLKDSGILSNKRLEEIKDYCADDKFGSLILKNDTVVKDWVVHFPTGHVFTNWARENSSHTIYDTILADFLTDEEIDRLNKDASRRFIKITEQKRFEKATKISEKDYYGPIYVKEMGWNDGYFSSVDELRDNIADEDLLDEGGNLPKYAWACKIEPSCHIDLQRVLDWMSESAHEEFSYKDMVGIEELQKAVDKFNNDNKEHVTWNPDYTRTILLKTEELTYATGD